MQWFIGSIWVIGSWITMSHGDSASISRFGWLGRVGWVMISRFGCFFFFLVFAMGSGCRVRSGRGRLLVCGCCCCWFFFFFFLMSFVVVVWLVGATVEVLLPLVFLWLLFFIT